MRRALVPAALFLLANLPAHAITLRISAAALERALRHQVFTSPGPDGKPSRHYLRGNPKQPCSVYAEDPHITFLHPGTSAGIASTPTTGFAEQDRIIVTVRTHANFGKAIGGFCLGIPISIESQVSFIPEAQGEAIGFRDARVDHASNSPELNALLEPFLAHRLPTEMKINAANLMRTLLVRAPDATGYTLTLTTLNLHSMQVEDQFLRVDLDADIKVD